jgi:hypothetical protein
MLGPRRNREWNRQHGHSHNQEAGNRHDQIADEPTQESKMLTPQRKSPLQNEKQEDQRPERGAGDGIKK